jgi:hypothetical protein
MYINLEMSKYSVMHTQVREIRSGFDNEIAKALRESPALSYRAAAKIFGCSLFKVFTAAQNAGISRVTGAKPATVLTKEVENA